MTAHRSFSRRRSMWVVVILMALWAPVSASAHKVVIFAWVEGDRVFTESKFSGGRLAKNAPVEIYDMAGNRLLEGRTDDNGRFDFPVPGPMALRIVLSAGQGHGNEWVLERDDIIDAADGEGARKDTDPPAPSPVTITKGPGHVKPHDDDRLKELVEAAVDRKLSPVLQQLRLLNERLDAPAFKDIVGGIGYIMGVVGIAAYLASKRQKGSSGQ